MEMKRTVKEPLDCSLHISLMGVEPLIWRRFRVPINITFQRLHEVIQIVMGWQDHHLFDFKYGPIRIGIPDGEYFIADDTHWDARRRRLSSIHPEPDDVMTYTYDFGDHWVHLLHFEWILYQRKGDKEILCLEGANCCPPEDVGGKSGYQDFLGVIDDPDDEEYEHYMEWSGGDFDPEWFAIASVNKQLQGPVRIPK